MGDMTLGHVPYSNAGVSNLRPAGQNWPASELNSAHLMNFETKKKNTQILHVMLLFIGNH